MYCKKAVPSEQQERLIRNLIFERHPVDSVSIGMLCIALYSTHFYCATAYHLLFYYTVCIETCQAFFCGKSAQHCAVLPIKNNT